MNKLVADLVLQSYHVFAMTSATKDLDNIFDGALQSLDLDLEGKLVQTLSLRGVFKLFEPTFHSFLSEWIENCSINGVCELFPPHAPLSILTLILLVNWRLYAQLVQVCVPLLNTMSLLVQSLLEVQGEQDLLPAFDYPQFEDSEYVPFFCSVFQPFFITYTKRSTFDDVNEWLSHWISRDDARMIAMDLQSHRNIGQGLCNDTFI